MPLSRLPRCLLWVLFAASSLFAHDPTEEFVTDVTTEAKPWTHLEFQNDPDNFQFAVVSDRTGSPRKGVFQDAVKKLNWMMPEFVVSVGDLIKGTSENATTNDAEWDEFLSWVEPLKMPFFFAAGNHDIQMKWIKGRVQPDDMLAAWNERFGTTHYSFVYKKIQVREPSPRAPALPSISRGIHERPSSPSQPLSVGLTKILPSH
ncbi:metallophosphoesterase [bacterium]|nr:metallophosphoesterase [bacterium]